MEKKRKVGRPQKQVKDRIEEKRFDLKVIEKLAIHGLTDKDLADILDVDERTINRWKKDEDFMSALKKGKLQADLEIEKSLWHRAKGYEHDDTYFANYQGQILTQKYTKHYPPDTAAAFIWLKNRRPEVWRDKTEVIIDDKRELRKKLGALSTEELKKIAQTNLN